MMLNNEPNAASQEASGMPTFHPQCRVFNLGKLLGRVALRLKQGQHFKAAELRVALEAVTKEKYDLALMVVESPKGGSAT